MLEEFADVACPIAHEVWLGSTPSGSSVGSSCRSYGFGRGRSKSSTRSRSTVLRSCRRSTRFGSRSLPIGSVGSIRTRSGDFAASIDLRGGGLPNGRQGRRAVQPCRASSAVRRWPGCFAPSQPSPPCFFWQRNFRIASSTAPSYASCPVSGAPRCLRSRTRRIPHSRLENVRSSVWTRGLRSTPASSKSKRFNLYGDLQCNEEFARASRFQGRLRRR